MSVAVAATPNKDWEEGQVLEGCQEGGGTGGGCDGGDFGDHGRAHKKLRVQEFVDSTDSSTSVGMEKETVTERSKQVMGQRSALENAVVTLEVLTDTLTQKSKERDVIAANLQAQRDAFKSLCFTQTREIRRCTEALAVAERDVASTRSAVADAEALKTFTEFMATKEPHGM